MKKFLKNTICRIGLHYYKPFKRSGEVNWLLLTVQGKRCDNCNKEILSEIL